VTTKRKLATAWTLLPAPIILFIPALALAGMGSCAFQYPLVIVVADVLYVGMEGTAIWLFARNRPISIGPSCGLVLASVMLVLTICVELLLVTNYM
jgi:hypothetical protein